MTWIKRIWWLECFNNVDYRFVNVRATFYILIVWYAGRISSLAPFSPNILNKWLFIPKKHFHPQERSERSIGIMHSHSETHMRTPRTIPAQFRAKKRALRSRPLRIVKVEGWSSLDDVSISTEINHELRSAGVVAQSSHRRKARSASGARPSISFPPCRWCVTNTCINLAHSNTYLVPCCPPTTPARSYREISNINLRIIVSEEERHD